jgi:UPF0271 protein
MRSIDLNCDMGEGCPHDAELMKYVSSANIACGFHAGDAATMSRTVAAAIENSVSIGAHPGYPDRGNFGRTDMLLPLFSIQRMVREQILALMDICKAHGTTVTHVKPHGALYNSSARNPELAAAIAECVYDIDPSLVLYGLSGSVSVTAAENSGLKTAAEVFADRTYSADGSLTSRAEPNALIADPDAAASQALWLATNGEITATDGTKLELSADTICIHGDGEHALQFAAAIHSRLLSHNIRISPLNG